MKTGTRDVIVRFAIGHYISPSLSLSPKIIQILTFRESADQPV